MATSPLRRPTCKPLPVCANPAEIGRSVSSRLQYGPLNVATRQSRGAACAASAIACVSFGAVSREITPSRFTWPSGVTSPPSSAQPTGAIAARMAFRRAAGVLAVATSTGLAAGASGAGGAAATGGTGDAAACSAAGGACG